MNAIRLCSLFVSLMIGSSSLATINEIRTDQPGTDDDEYFEIAGTPGSSLDGLHYVVIGDGASASGSGVIEVAIDLTGNSIPADGFFLAAESTFTLGTPDLVTNLDFENSDNVTHLVVSGFTSATGIDLDTNDDCSLDAIPWTSIVGGVALIEEANPPTGTECHYGTDLGIPIVGPDGAFVPGHVYAFPNGSNSYFVGDFDSFADDTPGVANVPEPSSCLLVLLGLLGVRHVKSRRTVAKE